LVAHNPWFLAISGTLVVLILGRNYRIGHYQQPTTVQVKGM